jgi:hypothetical protein
LTIALRVELKESLAQANGANAEHGEGQPGDDLGLQAVAATTPSIASRRRLTGSARRG